MMLAPSGGRAACAVWRLDKSSLILRSWPQRFRISPQPDATFTVEEWDAEQLVMQVPGFRSEEQAHDWIAERRRVDAAADPERDPDDR